ncbi:hypothetical protein HDU98_000613 [Podochytrium sp. JEL0797]|nr:hypothetical protein HDU98_000613 [Podochytrium sp. JEL0797]
MSVKIDVAPAAIRTNGGKINMHIPTSEKPVLAQIIQFRQSLSKLRKEAKDALTLTDINAKAAELSQIVKNLEASRAADTHENDPNEPRNRVDAVLDQAWMSMFAVWGKIGAINETIYPTYVSLVSLARSAEALRASEAWTPNELEILQERLRTLDEAVDQTEGKFGKTQTAQDAQSDKIPGGQAVLSSLLNRTHRVMNHMLLDTESIGYELVPLKIELDKIFKQLSNMLATGYTLDSLAPISRRLHQIDSGRGPAGNFSETEVQPGQATVAGILNACFEKLTLLVADLDPVTASSPLSASHAVLMQVHTELAAMLSNTNLRGNPKDLSMALSSVQDRLFACEQERVDGVFVPAGYEREAAIKLPGQATMHKLLHDCHAQISHLIEPIALPVGEALVPTYELLLKQRTRLRKLRGWASSGWNVRQDLNKVEDVLKTVESSKFKGLYVGDLAASALSPVSPTSPGTPGGGHFFFHGVPDGQSSIAALVDECDSLVWQISCML